MVLFDVEKYQNRGDRTGTVPTFSMGINFTLETSFGPTLLPKIFYVGETESGLCRN